MGRSPLSISPTVGADDSRAWIGSTGSHWLALGKPYEEPVAPERLVPPEFPLLPEMLLSADERSLPSCGRSAPLPDPMACGRFGIVNHGENVLFIAGSWLSPRT